jgi:hypothetical protein
LIREISASELPRKRALKSPLSETTIEQVVSSILSSLTSAIHFQLQSTRCPFAVKAEETARRRFPYLHIVDLLAERVAECLRDVVVRVLWAAQEVGLPHVLLNTVVGNCGKRQADVSSSDGHKTGVWLLGAVDAALTNDGVLVSPLVVCRRR